MVLGFIFVGPFIGRLWDKREHVFETFNRFENGSLSPSDWFKGKLLRITKIFSYKQKSQVVEVVKPDEKKPVEEPKKPFDWQASIDQYTKNR
jgi:hypothetical protein